MDEADQIMTGKDESSSDKLWGHRDKPLTPEEISAFGRKKLSVPSVIPFVRYKDHNNQNERDIQDCNPKHSAWEAGINISF